jgi:phosphoribosylformylglycinamidine synthase
MDLLALCGSPNLGSRAFVYRQYDHIVRGGTVVRPGSDAAVVRVPCEGPEGVFYKYLAFACDCNGRHVELAPEEGAKMAVAEVCRNLVVSGAEPIGITDCLNFGNPERPEIMDQLASAIDGLAAACRALSVPIVSGNVSLYNETTVDGARRPILPTPTVAAVGLIADPADIVTQWFARPGDVVIALGDVTSGGGLGGSELFVSRKGKVAGPPPSIDLDAEVALQRLVLELARARVLSSAHDVSEGGLLVALAECVATNPAEGDVGARLAIAVDPDPIVRTGQLFGERPTRVIVSVRPEHADDVALRARAAGVPVTRLGETGGDALEIDLGPALPAVRVGTARIREVRENCLAFMS